MSNRITVIAFLLAAAGARLGLACDFCSPMAGITMLTELDASEVAFIAELTVPTPTRKNVTAFDLMNRERQKGQAGFVVRQSMRGGCETDQLITVPLRVPGPSGSLHLITHDRSTNRWMNYRLSDDGLQFVLGAASLRVPETRDPPLNLVVRRLEFCLRFLGTDDFLLRKAVFAEFASASYPALQRLRPRLSRESVHAWLAKATKSAEQTRQLFLLLSLCGDVSDVAMLRQEFHQCIDSNWAGTLDAVILAYVALGGAAAIEDVDQTLLLSPDRSVELKTAAANALKFLVENKSDIGRPRLLQSYRRLLNHPQTAQTVVQDLARWEDWQWQNVSVE